MPTFHLLKSSFLILPLLFAFPPNARATTETHTIDDSPATESRLLSEPPDGYYLVNESEIEGLYEQPLNLLSDARQMFKRGEHADAAQDINTAAMLMKVQAIGEPKGSHLRETSDNLRALSQRVAKNEIKSQAALDSDLVRAARDEAEYHRIHATEAEPHHMYKNVGTDLKEAVNAVEKSAEWSGHKISERSEKVMTATKEISRKIKSGEKQTATEIHHGIASLETEIGHLDKEAKEDSRKK